MRVVSTDQLIEKLEVDVYPITLIKFLLNKRKILSYFSKAAEENFELRGPKYKINQEDCQECKRKIDDGVECRQHTSISRVMQADKVLFDLDTKTYFYMNEIFRMVGNRLVIVYCPHPKLIVGSINDSKVRRIRPITIEDPALTVLPNFKTIQFISSDLMDQHLKCWFNEEFSIITIPNDRNSTNWCLVSNK